MQQFFPVRCANAFAYKMNSMKKIKMKRYILRLAIVVTGIFSSLLSVAQSQEVEMADVMRSNGKIYIVVAVCLTILIGLFLYIMSVDRKLKRLENEK